MRHESGRSLIEVIGVLAIAGVMAAASIRIYTSIRATQTRTIAAAELENVAKNTKLLMGMRGDYTGLSVDYLIKAGALSSDRAPIGGAWSVDVGTDRTTFEIKLSGLSMGECDYFESAPPTWAAEMRVNGNMATTDTDYCFSSATNQVTFIVR